MGYLVFQAPRDLRGRLACPVFQEREGSLAPRDMQAEREKLERRAGLVPRETRERVAPKEREDPQEMKEKWL